MHIHTHSYTHAYLRIYLHTQTRIYIRILSLYTHTLYTLKHNTYSNIYTHAYSSMHMYVSNKYTCLQTCTYHQCYLFNSLARALRASSQTFSSQMLIMCLEDGVGGWSGGLGRAHPLPGCCFQCEYWKQAAASVLDCCVSLETDGVCAPPGGDPQTDGAPSQTPMFYTGQAGSSHTPEEDTASSLGGDLR